MQACPSHNDMASGSGAYMHVPSPSHLGSPISPFMWGQSGAFFGYALGEEGPFLLGLHSSLTDRACSANTVFKLSAASLAVSMAILMCMSHPQCHIESNRRTTSTRQAHTSLMLSMDAVPASGCSIFDGKQPATPSLAWQMHHVILRAASGCHQTTKLTQVSSR